MTTELIVRLRNLDHGFDRNGSHSEDRYVCVCEHTARAAADALEAQAKRIAELEKELAELWEERESFRQSAEKAEERVSRVQADRDAVERDLHKAEQSLRECMTHANNMMIWFSSRR